MKASLAFLLIVCILVISGTLGLLYRYKIYVCIVFNFRYTFPPLPTFKPREPWYDSLIKYCNNQHKTHKLIESILIRIQPFKNSKIY
jgi:hypothetical protein